MINCANCDNKLMPPTNQNLQPFMERLGWQWRSNNGYGVCPDCVPGVPTPPRIESLKRTDLSYLEFLQSKTVRHQSTGKEISLDDIHPVLFPFQRDLVRWAVRKGRCAIFADTGLGKTAMQIEWCRLCIEPGEYALIIAPNPSVAKQTVQEAHNLLGYDSVEYIRDGRLIDKPGTYVTNYQIIDHFDASMFAAVALDESSILKAETSKTRVKLIEKFQDTPFRSCYTATPAPNDIKEIGYHAEFLDVMTAWEMRAMFFVNDSKGWRLKGHAVDAFYKWMASWGMSVKYPSDLGYSDDGFILPKLNILPVWFDADYCPPDQLFFTGLSGINDRRKVRRTVIDLRIEEVAKIVNNSDEQFLVWCELNDESKELVKAIPDAREVQGKHSIEYKGEMLDKFKSGKIRVIVTKPKIWGFGVNLQHAHNMVFAGLSDSWEMYYQCIRREYRFGQNHPVNVYLVLANEEAEIYANVMKKEEQAQRMSAELIKNVQQYGKDEIAMTATKEEYETNEAKGKSWTLLQGDSAERLSELDDDSVGLIVTSPPFGRLYVYNASERDVGNSRNPEEFQAHISYIIKELYRVTMPGRVAAIHVMDIPAMQVRDGYIGLKDFSGDVIKAFIDGGWIYDSRIPIVKNQQAVAIRTNSTRLSKPQWNRDRNRLGNVLPDYILKFRKPGDNPQPIRGGMVFDEWIEWAASVWPSDDWTQMGSWEQAQSWLDQIDRSETQGYNATWFGIQESKTVQGWRTGAWHRNHGGKDEIHPCPLQLPTINRGIRLWSNPEDLVLDPFNGLGSTGHEALMLGRRYIGIELKTDYISFSKRVLTEAERQSRQVDLFDLAGVET